MASHRRTVAAAVATILASVSLYAVFKGSLWFWAGCGSVTVVAVTGTLTRMRRLPVVLTLACYAVALLLWLNIGFSNAGSLWHVLPTPGSLGALLHNAGRGFTEASKYAPPVPELRGMVVLTAAGIGIAAAGTDLIAVRLGNAALAGLPLLLLVTEPFTLSVSRSWIGTTLAFSIGAAGYLGLLSSEGRDRIREWDSREDSEWRRPDTAPLAATGRRVGFASIVLALCLPLVIPGLHTTRLFGGQLGIGGSGGSGGSAFPDPNSQVSAQLNTGTAQNVLSFTTSGTIPDYLTIYTLGTLTASNGWKMSPQPSDMVTGQSLPAEPGLNAGPRVSDAVTNISIAQGVAPDEDGALPVPYPPTSISVSGTVKSDKNTLMVYDSGASLGGLHYTVHSLQVQPNYTDLQKVPAAPASITSQYLAVPASYDTLKPLAQSVTKGATSQFIAAVDLQNWLSGAGSVNGGIFHYSLKAPSVLNAAGLTKFLEVTRSGYCMQYAYSMAVLARLLDIPSRLEIGYTPGAPNAAGQNVVTTHDAHAWPELYFSGYGWLRFEPTPAGASVGQPGAFPPTYTYVNAPGTGAQSPGRPNTAPSGLASNQHVKDQVPLIYRNLGSSSAAGVSPWLIAGLVVAFLAVAGAAAPWCARRAVRRRRWLRKGRNAAPADRVRARDIAWAHAAWAELRDDLADHGAPSLPSDSPRAVAARAGTRLAFDLPARDALSRIAMAEERARYAPAPSDGSMLRSDSFTVRRAIATAVPRGARWRARLLPLSVVRPVLGGLASLGSRWSGRQRPGQ